MHRPLRKRKGCACSESRINPTTAVYATEEDLAAIDAKIKQQVEEAVKFSEESPWPDASEIFTDVYVQEDYPFIVD